MVVLYNIPAVYVYYISGFFYFFSVAKKHLYIHIYVYVKKKKKKKNSSAVSVSGRIADAGKMVSDII